MDPARVAELAERHLTEFRDSAGIPGLAFAVVRDGNVVHAGGTGETEVGSGVVPDSDTVFRIASMTKSVTASTALLLRDRGVLRLDDAIAAHLPWTERLAAPDGGHPITVRDLLTMVAGFPTDDPWGDRQEGLPIADFDALVAGGLSFARVPRTGWEYSNLGYALLGRVITQATGTDYHEVVRTELLEPLGMSATRFDVDDVPTGVLAQGYAPVDAGLVPEPVSGPGAFSPMGGLFSTVRDLATWVAGFQASHRDDDLHPVDRWSRREMQEPQRLIGTTASIAADGTAGAVTTSYGFGLVVQDDSALGRIVSHSGGYPGYGSHMRWHPESGWGVIVLGNRTYAPAVRVGTALLADILTGSGPGPSPTAPRLWPRTTEAMLVVETLLGRWDDALADAWFAVNVDLDQPRAERRAAVERVAADLGRARAVAGGTTSTSPARATWLLEGERGRGWAEVLLSPESPALIQAMRVGTGSPPADQG
jgi:CubicO group peptidase (beta-lactamase class C family)